MTDPVNEGVGQIEVDGTYVLASAQRDQVALIIRGEEHTAFTAGCSGCCPKEFPAARSS